LEYLFLVAVIGVCDNLLEDKVYYLKEKPKEDDEK
jgi:hypothetical protein